jgi:hypothetical protein
LRSDGMSLFFLYDSTAPWGPRPRHCTTLHDHTDRHITLGRTHLDEGPVRRRDLYLTTHNTHKRQTSMTPGGILFFSLSRFFPLIHFVLLNPSVLHVTCVPFYCPYTTQTSMPPVGFEPIIPLSERPQTHALDRTATGIGRLRHIIIFHRSFANISVQNDNKISHLSTKSI